MAPKRSIRTNSRLSQLLKPRTTGTFRKSRRGYQPRVEALEERTVPTLYNSPLALSLAVGGAATGNGGSDVSGPRTISASGRYGVFTSTSSNLVAGLTDTNIVNDVFLRDFQTGALSLVSVNSAGTGAGAGTSDQPTISADGRYVAFRSNATNLALPDINAFFDIYVRDLVLGTTTLISVNSAGTNGGNNTSQNPTISGDGQLVAWESFALDMVSGITDTNGTSDIFLRNWRAATPATTLVSRASSGTATGNAVSSTSLLSVDGSSLAFISNATNLLIGVTDNNNVADIFAYDVAGGTLSLVSAEPTTLSTGNLASTTAARTVSADGRYQVLVSAATNLVAGMSDVNGATDVFVRDLQTGTTTLVSINSAGTGTGANISDSPTISADGRYVAFRSAATNLPGGSTNGQYQIYARDLTLNTTTLISVNSAGDNGGNSTSQNPTISGDGQFVAWESYATNLVSGITDGNGERDIFLRNWRAVTPMTTLVSRNSAGTGTANAFSSNPQLSVDGSTLAYLSNASNLNAGVTDNNNTTDVYAYALGTGATSLLSAEPNTAGTSNAASTTAPRTVSANGRYEVFTSIATNLVAGMIDVNAQNDVFVRDLQTGTTTLVSVNSAGTGTGNITSDSPTISADGRYVAFRSNSTNLAAPDTNTFFDIFVRDLVLGTTTLISVNTAGDNGGNSTSQNPTISGNGQLVAWESIATNLVSGLTDENGLLDVFLRNWQAGTPVTTLVSRNSAGTGPGSASSTNPLISVDGSTVAFLSNATNLVAGATDNNNAIDVFGYDVASGTRSLLSAEPTTLATGNFASTAAVRTISADGRYEVFASNATNLVAGMIDVNGTTDVFRRDLQTGVTTLVSVNSAGTGTGSATSDSPTISADGRYVAFRSNSINLAAPDTNGFQDIFVRDLTLGTTTLISVNSAGNNGGNNQSQSPTISGDGQLVAYESYADNLITGFTDSNGDRDIFLRNWQAATPTTTLVSRNSAGTGTGNVLSYSALFSADGSTLAFLSAASNLVAGLTDTNGTYDVFAYNVAAPSVACMSVTSAGNVTGNNVNDSVVLSDNGRYVAFRTFASNLGMDTNGSSDVYVRDRVLSTTILVSVNSAGTASSNFYSDMPSISSDGRYVAFRSGGSNIAATDTNFSGDVFVRDLQTSMTTLISVNSAGNNGGNSDAQGVSISGNGQQVAWSTLATDMVSGFVDGNVSGSDVFIRNWLAATPATTLVSRNRAGTASGNDTSTVPVLSGNGATLIFQSNARNLVSGASDINGTLSDVFAFDTATATTSIVSVKAAGIFSGNNLSDQHALSNDGQIVAFRSQGNSLTGNDTNPYTDVYVRNRTTNTTNLVSIDSTGTASSNYYSDMPAVSGNGQFVAFRSGGSNVAAPDANFSGDVFVRNLLTSTTTLVSPNSAGNNGGNGDAASVAISDDGAFVAYATPATDLISGFVDGNGGAPDIFIRNWMAATPTTTLVSRNSAGTASGNNPSTVPVLSGNGMTLIFQSTANNLLSGLSDLNAAASDVFAFDTGTGVTSLVSVKAPGDFAGNGLSDSISMSDDGQIVAFRSSAFNLTGNDANGYQDVYVRNRATNTTSLVSINSAGTASSDWYADMPAVSGNGQFVAFRGGGSNVAAPDTNFNGDVFVRNLLTNVTTLISINSAGTNGGNGEAQAVAISGDGQLVAYVTTSTNLIGGFVDGNAGGADLFLRNWMAATPVTTLVSRNSAGTASGNNTSSVPHFTGSLLTFQSQANNLLGGVSDLNGVGTDVFTYAPGTGTTSLVSAKVAGLFAGNGSSDQVAMSDNGQVIAFRSFASSLGHSDTNTYQDVYVRDRGTSTTSLVSLNSAGTFSSDWYSETPSVSGDGRYIAFRSGGSNIAPPDANFTGDIFVRDRQTSMTTLVSINSAGTAGGNGESETPIISRDGQWVAWASTATTLVSGITDTNSTYDVFIRNWRAATPETELLSRTPAGTATGNSSSSVAAISAIGTTVLWDSNANNLAGVTDGNASPDVFAATEAIPPTVVSISELDADDLVPVNVMMIYTITFNEDINEASLTAADIDNGGTAAITLGAIIEISPGVFTVEVTPTTGGTIRLRIPTGAIVRDMVGNNLVPPVLDDDTIVVDGVPPVASFDDGDIDDLVPVNQTILYTITFSSDVNSATVSVSDFDSAGTATIAFGTLTDMGGGVFTLQVTPSTAGTIVLLIDGAVQDTAGNFLEVPVQDDTTVTVDAVPPTVNTIDDSDADNLIAINTFVTYTVTFSEDMDALSVTAADFDNAGTSALSFGTITETSAGVFEVNVMATTPGTLQLRIPTGAVVKDVAGNNLVPPVLDSDTLTVRTELVPPTLVSIDDADADNLVAVNKLLTYTVRFSEDMNAATVSAADFDNAGTAGITLGTVTETTPGVFEVQVTPTSAGTILLRINGDVQDVAGNSLVTPVQDDTTLTVDAVLPTVLSMDDGDANNQVAANTLLTYTIMFSEDIDAPTLTAADFTNAGTSDITLGAITETTPGVFTVQVTPTTIGTLQLRLPAGAVVQDIAGNELVTPVTDDDTVNVVADDVPPTIVSMDDGEADNQVAANVLLLYTITFSEDMNAASVTAADFDNAGTSAVTIGAITETSAGVFSVEVTATTVGTLQLRIPSGAVLLDLGGNALEVPFVDDDTINIVADDIRPTVLSIDDNDADNLVPVNQVVAYTVLFDEDINDASVTAEDFANAGSATIAIGTITETSAGVFSVQVTPSTAGTIVLRIPAGAVIEDLAGNDLIVPVQDDTAVTVDAVLPTVLSIDDGDADNLVPVNQMMTFTLTFSEDIDAATLSAADLDNAGTAAVTLGAINEPVAGVFTVDVTPTTGGTIVLRINGVVQDVAGNSLVVPVQDDTTVTVDAVAPTVVGIDDADADNLVPVSQMMIYTLTFSEDIDAATLSAADLNNAGTAAVTLGAINEPTPGVFTVEVTPTTGGTIILRINGVVRDVAGNSLAVPVQDDTTVDVDAVAPIAVSIDDADADNLVPVNQMMIYTLTFSEDIDAATLSVADLDNAGTAAVTLGAINEPTPGVFTVEMTPTTGGTIILRINGVVRDVAGNSLAVPVQDDTTVDVDAVAPIAVSIDDADADNLVPVNQMMIYTLTFSEDIDAATLSVADLDNAGTAAVTLGAINEPTPGVFTVEMTPTTGGTIILRINGVVRDVAGNSLSVPVQDDTTVDVDAIAPTVTSIDDADADDLVPVNQLMTYTLTFSEDIDAATFSAVDLDNAGTAAVTLGAINETADGVFTVEMTPTTGGTIILRINGVVRDVAGNSLAVPVQDDTTVAVDAVAPTVVSIDDADEDNLVPVNQMMIYTLTFSEDIDAATLTAADVDNAGTAAVTFGAINEPTPGAFTVEVTPATGGTIILRINGVVRDVAGNSLAVPVQDDTTVDVDAIPPTVTSIEDADADNLVPVSQMMIYTLMFSEDIDAATLSAADLDNAGTAALTFGAINEPTPGVFTVEVTPTTGGTIILRINGVVRDVAGNSLAVPVQDDTTVAVDAVAPTVTSIEDGDADNTVLFNTLLTYTITFSEDIDAASVSAADFNNAGTAAITLGTITETTPGVFSVQVTPTTAGTLQLRIPAGAVIMDMAGNNLTLPVLDNDTLTVIVDADPPIVVSIDDGDADNIAAVSQMLLYTITFNEDINASSVAAADFNNAGTGALTIGTITETLPGVFTVQVTPTTAGTLILRINGVINDVNGNALVIPVQDDTTVTVGFSSITGQAFNDLDGDGVKDADEPGAPNITINLDRGANGSIQASTMTDGAGNYAFSNLQPGLYRIRVDLAAGVVQTSPNPADIPLASGNDVTGINFGLGRETIIALGADKGSPPRVQVFDHNNVLRFSFLAYGASFTGGVRVATGDVTGDGIADIIVGPGAGRATQIRVFDGNPVAPGNLTPVEVARFQAFPAAMKKGLFVAVGDVNGDGRNDIITGAGAGELPEVRIFNGTTLLQPAPTLIGGGGFLAFAPTFTGGVTVAAGDIDGDGRAEIVTGVAKKSAPLVNVWELAPAGNQFNLLESFQGLPASFTRGVSVAVGDFTGDGRRDIIVSSAKGSPPLLQVFGTDPGNDVIFAGPATADVGVNVYAPGSTAGTRIVARSVWEPVTAGLVAKSDIWAGFGIGSATRAIRRLAHNSTNVTDEFFANAAEFERGIFVG